MITSNDGQISSLKSQVGSEIFTIVQVNIWLIVQLQSKSKFVDQNFVILNESWSDMFLSVIIIRSN